MSGTFYLAGESTIQRRRQRRSSDLNGRWSLSVADRFFYLSDMISVPLIDRSTEDPQSSINITEKQNKTFGYQSFEVSYIWLLQYTLHEHSNAESYDCNNNVDESVVDSLN